MRKDGCVYIKTYHVRILNLTDLESDTFLIGHEQPCDL